MIAADPSVRVGPIFSLSPFDSSRRVQYARHRNGQSRLVLDLPPAALPLNSDVRDVRDVFLNKTLVEPLLGRTLTPADSCAVRSALQIPTALADYYAAVGAIDVINRPHNRLLGPSELRVEDGMVVFYEENQCVAFWAIREGDLHLPDPTVYQGLDTTAGLEWHSEDMTVSRWFPVMIYWQIVNGGFPFVGYAAAIEDAERAVS